MSNIKIINPSEESMSIMMQRDLIPATGIYDTVKSTFSSMDDPYSHVLE